MREGERVKFGRFILASASSTLSSPPPPPLHSLIHYGRALYFNLRLRLYSVDRRLLKTVSYLLTVPHLSDKMRFNWKIRKINSKQNRYERIDHGGNWHFQPSNSQGLYLAGERASHFLNSPTFELQIWVRETVQN